MRVIYVNNYLSIYCVFIPLCHMTYFLQHVIRHTRHVTKKYIARDTRQKQAHTDAEIRKGISIINNPRKKHIQ